MKSYKDLDFKTVEIRCRQALTLISYRHFDNVLKGSEYIEALYNEYKEYQKEVEEARTGIMKHVMYTTDYYLFEIYKAYNRQAKPFLDDVRNNFKNPPQYKSIIDTDTAKAYFSKTIEKGLISINNDGSYTWNKGLQLLSCFSQQMSDALNLSKSCNSDGTKRIAWKPFEELFNIERGKLRSNFNDIKKTGCFPADIEMVDSIFK